MEDTEDILSTVGDFMARSRHILASSDNMDFSTKQSHIEADMYKTFCMEDEQDESFVGMQHWHTKICAWASLMLTESGHNISFPIKRDDRLTGLTYYAAYMSIRLVKEELHLGMPYHYCGAKRTIKCIYEAVITCFDLLCKNLLIEQSWDAINLKESIIKAADFATDYLISQTDQLDFQVDREDEDILLSMLQEMIIGNFGQDIFSTMQPSTKVMNDDVVGLNSDLQKIKERLLRPQSKLDIIPIVGMGGIGKTTLTRKVYKDPEIMPHFHIFAWIVISQEFRERDVLLGLLESIAPLPNEVCKEDTEHLAEILYRRLKGWRYFIVLDDVWTPKAWDHMKLCFPNDNNGSRIIITSRIIEVASHVDPENPPHYMSFLGMEDSWELLCKKVYGKNACPHQLINIGMQIAEKCQGLPLAIEVMAGYLSNITKTKECWDEVAKKVGFPTQVTQMESLSNILSISYNDLPPHLKACFLTMANFPKNFEISVRKLIQMWTAMGFLHQMFPNNVEEVAMKCFENLVDRSLIMVKKKKFDGKNKLCGIHDLLWDLSMREFRKEGHIIYNKPLWNSKDMNACDDDSKYIIGSHIRFSFGLSLDGYEIKHFQA